MSYRVPHFPIEDEKLRATSLIKRRGGNGANSLEVLAQLVPRIDEKQLILLAPLPEERSSDFQFIESSLGPNVTVSRHLCREGVSEAASSYIIRNAENASRTIVNHNPLKEMELSEFKTFAEQTHEESHRLVWWHFEVRTR